MRMVLAAGIGTYLRQLVPRVRRTLPSLDLCLLGHRETLTRFAWADQPGVAIVECGAPIYSLREQGELAVKIPSNTDLYWSPHYNIPLLYRGRLLVTVHDTFHLAMPQFVKGWHRRLYSRVMFRAVRFKATGIVCVSRFAKDQLLKYCPVGTQDITVVHNGVDPSWSAPVPGPSPHARPYLLFVGSVKPHKNLPRLLEAFDRLLEKIPHDLVMIGRDKGFITGDALVNERLSSMQERVTCIGEMDHDDPLLRQFYAHADALILPSLYESFGLPALEAAASGCPIIVSRAGGLPEVYGESALYCDPYDVDDMAKTIFQMVTDRELRRRHIDRGRALAARYNWDQAAHQTSMLIQRLLA
ncbi:MAG: glycosyltransferase family 1 protein [Thermomicrobiales bacterium]|nr:MAG: glycosyltransferase family 1 protein [Thermomicrobiales bacterium]